MIIMNDNIYEKLVLTWGQHKGIGTIQLPNIVSPYVLLTNLLLKMYSKNTNRNIIIIVNNDNEKINCLNIFNTFIKNNNLKINIFNDCIKRKLLNNITGDLLILLNIDSIFESYDICYAINNFKFRLFLYTNNITNKQKQLLFSICPVLEDIIDKQYLISSRLDSPVEERQIGITIPCNSKEYNFIKKANEYLIINNRIFGSLQNMDKARVGDRINNISSIEYCTELAYENGWNPTLDMSIEMNRDLDKLYNPKALQERAKIGYDVIRERNQMLSDNTSKLIEIWNIVKENLHKKILIISKRSEFANAITNYINEKQGYSICANFHNKMDSVPAMDDNFNIILYKTGIKKGQPKMLGVDAQKTLNKRLFLNNKINILSCNSAVDKTLTGNVDIVIITSPQCESIKSYFYRLSEIIFSSPLQLYTIFCKDTTEERNLANKELLKNQTVINNVNNSELTMLSDSICIVD